MPGHFWHIRTQQGTRMDRVPCSAWCINATLGAEDRLADAAH
jgi:hypothetical protein